MNIFNKINTTEKRKTLRSNQTDAERKLWQRLRHRNFLGLKFYRQYGIGTYIVDFYCPKLRLIIEVDGGKHYAPDGIAYDYERKKYLVALGLKILRFSNLEVLKEMDAVLERIRLELNSPQPPLS